MPNSLVSIIIPSYNSCQFLQDTLESVFKQTYPNIEIIVVNDGSTDKTDTVIQPYLSRIKYVNQINKGVAAARNNGFQISRGDYICFLDADDWFFETNIENKLRYLEENYTIGLVHGLVDITNQSLLSTGKTFYGKAGPDLMQSLINFELPIPCPSNVLIRRSVLEDIGQFDENLTTAADFDLWVRICKKYTVGMVHYISIKYRQHSANMFSDKTAYKHDMEYIYKKHFSKRENWSLYLRNVCLFLAIDSYKKKNWNNAIFYSIKWLKTFLITPEINFFGKSAL